MGRVIDPCSRSNDSILSMNSWAWYVNRTDFEGMREGNKSLLDRWKRLMAGGRGLALSAIVDRESRVWLDPWGAGKSLFA